MEIATVYVKMDSRGSGVTKYNVTPAEAILLNSEHKVNAKGRAVHDIKITGNKEMDALKLKIYLKARYRKKLWETTFPGEQPNFPETFDEVNLTGITEEKKLTPEAAFKNPADSAPDVNKAVEGDDSPTEDEESEDAPPSGLPEDELKAVINDE